MNKVRENLAGLIGFVWSLVFALLGLRLVLRLFGANSGNRFVDWIYDTSQPILQPFQNAFPTVRIEDGFVLELSTLFAIVVYALLTSLALYLNGWFTKNTK